jgi:hypothetical protein
LLNFRQPKITNLEERKNTQQSKHKFRYRE